MIAELNENNFENEIKNGLKLVEFYASWCKFCINQETVLNELSDNNFWIGKLDCEKYPKTAARYGIGGFPAFILFKNGKISAQFSGYHTKSQLLNKLMNYIQV